MTDITDELSPLESKLVRCLESAGGKWVLHRDILEQVYPGQHDRTLNSVRVFKCSISVKRPDLQIESRRRFGYRLVPS